MFDFRIYVHEGGLVTVKELKLIILCTGVIAKEERNRDCVQITHCFDHQCKIIAAAK